MANNRVGRCGEERKSVGANLCRPPEASDKQAEEMAEGEVKRCGGTSSAELWFAETARKTALSGSRDDSQRYRLWLTGSAIGRSSQEEADVEVMPG